MQGSAVEGWGERTCGVPENHNKRRDVRNGDSSAENVGEAADLFEGGFVHCGKGWWGRGRSASERSLDLSKSAGSRDGVPHFLIDIRIEID